MAGWFGKDYLILIIDLKHLELKQQICKVKGKRMSYWKRGSEKKGKNIILLAPGSYGGDFFQSFATMISDEYTLIAPDYPGRGFSDELIEHDTFDLIAQSMIDLIRFLDVTDAILVGVSFGTAVANEILNTREDLFEQAILVAPGEFFSDIQDAVLKTIFFPSKFSDSIRKLYRYLLIKFFHMKLPQKNLKSILEQWISTLDYRIEKRKKLTLPVVLIHFKNDQIIPKDSISKLKEIYTNHVEEIIGGDHPLSAQIPKELIEEVYRKAIEYIL